VERECVAVGRNPPLCKTRNREGGGKGVGQQRAMEEIEQKPLPPNRPRKASKGEARRKISLGGRGKVGRERKRKDERRKHSVEKKHANNGNKKQILKQKLTVINWYKIEKFVKEKEMNEIRQGLQFKGTLQLSKMNLKTQLDALGCLYIAPALETMTGLKQLYLDNNKIGATGSANLTPSFIAMASLNTLSLYGNEINAVGCKYLSSALGAMAELQHLALGANFIDSAGCRHLALALKTMTGLRSLYLNNNKIDAVGCEFLEPALKAMAGLEILHLSENQIDNVGCKHLAAAFQTMKGLEKLDLAINKIGTAGCDSLASTLSHMKGLDSLTLDFNEIHEGHKARKRGMFSQGSKATGKELMKSAWEDAGKDISGLIL
jgi:Ran GTPase-activating protein (RanGAP) involved in mRNA processing and transport